MYKITKTMSTAWEKINNWISKRNSDHNRYLATNKISEKAVDQWEISSPNTAFGNNVYALLLHLRYCAQTKWRRREEIQIAKKKNIAYIYSFCFPRSRAFHHRLPLPASRGPPSWSCITVRVLDDVTILIDDDDEWMFSYLAPECCLLLLLFLVCLSLLKSP